MSLVCASHDSKLRLTPSMPDARLRSDLDAALGRYRVLFEHDLGGWDAFIDALMRPLPACLWTNPLRIGAAELQDLLAAEGVPAERVPWLGADAASRAPRDDAIANGLNPPGIGSQRARGDRSGVLSSVGHGLPMHRAHGLSGIANASPAVGSPDPIGCVGLQLPLGVRAGQHWWYCAGLAHAQEAVSQLPVRLLAPRPGERVLDLCAAPGGKTAQIAMALGNQGTLIANDFAAERISALQGNLDRLGVTNVSTTRCDGGNFPVAAGAFDRVLVDAPCSSEGTLRRHPSLAQAQSSRQGTAPAAVSSRGPAGLHARIGPERSLRMAGRQRALLRKAVQLCRPGGRILYSTCTFAPEENELIVADILDEQAGDLALLPANVPGLRTGAGVTAWQGRRLDPALARCLRIWPHLNDTGGFFMALLEKSSTAPGPAPAAQASLSADTEDSSWLNGLAADYGFTDSDLAPYRIHRQTRRGLHLIAADHRPAAAPIPQGSGLFAYRTNIRPPKLTTAGALLLGRAATRNRLGLTAAQRDQYLRRELLRPTASQTADCQLGQVIVTYEGFPLGVGVLHRSGDLESLFPRRWSGCTAAG